ncbi:hypothetical protein GCK32_010819 [Trichostrongylus colubriformis]|uniref:Uncharacterized protein n=1 Tax=Trichostrongylus colubriformis TaxID=6319 RepID=A0AAN8FZV2_TRICO
MEEGQGGVEDAEDQVDEDLLDSGEEYDYAIRTPKSRKNVLLLMKWHTNSTVIQKTEKTGIEVTQKSHQSVSSGKQRCTRTENKLSELDETRGHLSCGLILFGQRTALLGQFSKI